MERRKFAASTKLSFIGPGSQNERLISRENKNARSIASNLHVIMVAAKKQLKNRSIAPGGKSLVDANH